MLSPLLLSSPYAGIVSFRPSRTISSTLRGGEGEKGGRVGELYIYTINTGYIIMTLYYRLQLCHIFHDE